MQNIFKELPQVLSACEMDFDPIWAKVPHKSNNHELIHVLSGEFTLQWEESGEKFHLKAGDTAITPAGTIHRDIFDFEQGLEVFLVHFDWTEFDSFSAAANNNQLASTKESQIRRLFDDMRLDAGSSEVDRMVANARFMNILMLYYREAVAENAGDLESDNVANKRQWLVAEARKYLERHFRKPLRLEDVAEALNVSPFYLSRVFSRESDFSLVQYLTDLRINEAKKLLKEGRYIVADVARMVGFDSGNYFSKVFKKHTGTSPAKYT
jgi:two-component system response regulator YesN